MVLENSRSTIFICFAAAFGGLLFGFDTAVISGIVQPVTLQFDMSPALEGWFVSSGLVGCIIGVLAAGFLSDRIGRKPVLMIAAIAFLFSGIGCSLAGSADMLVLFRVMGGIGVGTASVISPRFIRNFPLPGYAVKWSLYTSLQLLRAYFLLIFLTLYCCLHLRILLQQRA